VQEDDLESDFNAIEPSSFMTELKSARTDEDMLEVSVRFEFDWDAMVMPTIPFGKANPPAPLPDETAFSLLSSSDDIDSPPEPDRRSDEAAYPSSLPLPDWRSDEAAYPSSLPLPIASVSDLVPSDESSHAPSGVIEDIFRFKAQFTPTLLTGTQDLDEEA